MREIINGNNLALGTCYYPEHWDRSLWEEDLSRTNPARSGSATASPPVA